MVIAVGGANRSADCRTATCTFAVNVRDPSALVAMAVITASSSELAPVAALSREASVPATTIRSPTVQPVVGTPAGTVKRKAPGSAATPGRGFVAATLASLRVSWGSVTNGVTSSPWMSTAPCETIPRANWKGSSSVSNGSASENCRQSGAAMIIRAEWAGSTRIESEPVGATTIVSNTISRSVFVANDRAPSTATERSRRLFFTDVVAGSASGRTGTLNAAGEMS